MQVRTAPRGRVVNGLILNSLLIMSVAVPMKMARAKNPVQGLKSALAMMAMFDVVYCIALYLHNHLA